MKKLGLLLLASMLFAGVQAQQVLDCDCQLSPKYYQANWFLSGAVGANAMFGSADGEAGLSARLSPQHEFYVGKWFSNIWGARLGVTGYQLRGYQNQVPNGPSYIGGPANVDNVPTLYHQKFNYWNPNLNLLFNFSAAVCKQQRHIYEAIPYLGVGYAVSFMHGWKDGPTECGLSVNGGLINAFHVSQDVDLNLNLNAAAVGKKFDKENSDLPFKGIASVTVGLTWKL